jgi:hypothetical protein
MPVKTPPVFITIQVIVIDPVCQIERSPALNVKVNQLNAQVEAYSQVNQAGILPVIMVQLETKGQLLE